MSFQREFFVITLEEASTSVNNKKSLGFQQIKVLSLCSRTLVLCNDTCKSLIGATCRLSVEIPATVQNRSTDAQVRSRDKRLCSDERRSNIGYKVKIKDARGSLLSRPLKNCSEFQHISFLVCMFCVLR